MDVGDHNTSLSTFTSCSGKPIERENKGTDHAKYVKFIEISEQVFEL